MVRSDRILDEEHLNACKKAVALRARHTPAILELARQSATEGEPIVRSMEYVFPHQGYGRVKDQFLLGDHILVAPMLEKGKNSRSVVLPRGTWKDWKGNEASGPTTVRVDVGLDELPVFERVVGD